MDAGGRSGGLPPFGRSLAGWWRFPKYEIRDGVIRPAYWVKPEHYDPWAAYRVARTGKGGKGGHAPYASLLELVWSVRLVPNPAGGPATLEPESERLVLDWCTANGLLGVLPHEAELAYLWPRWESTDAIPEAGLAGVPVAPVQRSYTTGPNGWAAPYDVTWRTKDTEFDALPKIAGTLVPEELAAEMFRPPTALHRTLAGGKWVALPLTAGWGPYFPDVPAGEKESHPYPQPLTDAFWLAYAEPVDVFLSAAALFSKAVRAVAADWRPDEGARENLVRLVEAEDTFYGLTVGVQPGFDRTDPRLGRAWRAKSLLASFAMMAYLDLTEGGRIADCDECGRPYVSGAYQARYCSARCRNTALKRTYRGRLRERRAAGGAND